VLFRSGTEGAARYGGAIAYAVVTTVGAAVAASWCARRAAWSPATLLGGVVVLVAGGFTFAGWIVHSELPVALPAAVARLTVAVLLGAGAGCIVTGVRHLSTATPAAPVARAAPTGSA